MKEAVEGFLDCFKSLKDPRSTRNQIYSVSEILLVVLSAAIVVQRDGKMLKILEKLRT